MVSSYSEFPPPGALLKTPNVDRAMGYLYSLNLHTASDLIVFLHQVRAARPPRVLGANVFEAPPTLTVDADASLWECRFEWCAVKSSLEPMLHAFVNGERLCSITLNEMIAACLLSELLAYPVACEWEPGALSRSTFEELRPLRTLFPWDSQLWIHFCSEKSDCDQITSRGLNPALVVCTEDVVNGWGEWPTLCPAAAYDSARKLLRFHRALAASGDQATVSALCVRQPYVAGLGELGYFGEARSSQDSLSFFAEEQHLRRRIFQIGLAASADATALHVIDTLFALKSGKTLDAVSDCSFAYRHRSREDRALDHMTELELRGLVRHGLGGKLGGHENLRCDTELEHLRAAPDEQALVASLAGGTLSTLDDSALVLRRLNDTDVPFAVFLDGSPVEALALFVLLPLARRLESRGCACPIQIFTSRRKRLSKGIDHRRLGWLAGEHDLLVQGIRAGLVSVIGTEQVADGINLRQMGAEAQHVLLDLARKRGVLLSHGEDALITLKNLDLPWVNIGQVKSRQVAALSGLRTGDGYALCHVPPAPAYVGFPVVNRTLSSLRQGSRPAAGRRVRPGIVWESVHGVTQDGAPFSGVVTQLAQAVAHERRLHVELSPQPRPLPEIVERFQRGTERRVLVAWNGGYFISRKLQAGSGYPREWWGKPLGLLKTNGQVVGLPLFDRRPVLVIDTNGQWSVKELQVSRLTIGLCDRLAPAVSARVEVDSDVGQPWRDQATLYGVEHTPARVPDGAVAICFLFDEILQVFGRAGQLLTGTAPHFTLLIPARDYDPAWQPGARLTFGLDEYSQYPSMVQAGPWLVRAGAAALDLEREGWTLAVSKRLQASPIQYHDLRTARTVFCTLENGGLATLTINSRTDESVGLTHREACDFIQAKLSVQIEDAFEFDSGGSVTLWAEGELLNICSTLDENTQGQRPRSLARPIATAILLTEV